MQLGAGLLGLLASPDGVVHQVHGGPAGGAEGFIGLLQVGVDPLGLFAGLEGVFGQAQGGPAGGLNFFVGGLEFGDALAQSLLAGAQRFVRPGQLGGAGGDDVLQVVAVAAQLGLGLAARRVFLPEEDEHRAQDQEPQHAAGEQRLARAVQAGVFGLGPLLEQPILFGLGRIHQPPQLLGSEPGLCRWPPSAWAASKPVVRRSAMVSCNTASLAPSKRLEAGHPLRLRRIVLGLRLERGQAFGGLRAKAAV